MNKYNFNILFLVVLILVLLIVFHSCEKEDDPKNLTNKIEVSDVVVSDISYKTAKLSSKIPNTYNVEIEEFGHCWSLDSIPDINDSITVYKEFSNDLFTSELSGLKHNSTYFFRAYCKYDDFVMYSPAFSFKTLEIKAPTVITDGWFNLTVKSLEIGGHITDSCGVMIDSCGFYYFEEWNPTICDSILCSRYKDGFFYGKIENLKLNTEYAVRAFAISEGGISYGDGVGFTTKDGVIDIATKEATNITSTTASSGGVFTDDEGLEIIEKGLCWNTIGNPTIDDQKVNEGVVSESFSSNIAGLSSDTKYYIRSFIINELGISYGDEKEFTTNDGRPIIKTVDLNEITFTSLKSGGDIITDEGSTITEKGICWNTTGSPVVTDTKINEGIGSEDFISYIDNLTEGETYHIRAYAINENGIAYGTEQSVSLTDEFVSIQDFDGNWYNTVKIGNQIWLKENLRATHYPDGSLINNGAGLDIYNSNEHEYYFEYEDDIVYVETYGRLYTWKASTKACPDGWHLPTKNEWDELLSFVGKGGKLKSIGTIEDGTGLWYSPNEGATNEFGFFMHPAGIRHAFLSKYDFLGHTTGFSFIDDGEYYYAFGSNTDDYVGVVSGNGYPKNNGHPVRCIKD